DRSRPRLPNPRPARRPDPRCRAEVAGGEAGRVSGPSAQADRWNILEAVGWEVSPAELGAPELMPEEELLERLEQLLAAERPDLRGRAVFLGDDAVVLEGRVRR